MVIQIIKCRRCGKTYAGCRVPECYEDRHWQTSVRRAAKQGDIIEMVDAESFTLEACNCDQLPKLKVDDKQIDIEF